MRTARAGEAAGVTAAAANGSGFGSGGEMNGRSGVVGTAEAAATFLAATFFTAVFLAAVFLTAAFLAVFLVAASLVAAFLATRLRAGGVSPSGLARIFGRVSSLV